MELTTSFSKLILSFCLLTIGVAAFACQSADGDFTNPRIQQGKVRIAGEITDEAKGVFRQPIFMTFSFIHPITGETIRKEVETDSLGRYSIEVETEPILRSEGFLRMLTLIRRSIWNCRRMKN